MTHSERSWLWFAVAVAFAFLGDDRGSWIDLVLLLASVCFLVRFAIESYRAFRND